MQEVNKKTVEEGSCRMVEAAMRSQRMSVIREESLEAE